jgi:beta-lactamase class A
MLKSLQKYLTIGLLLIGLLYLLYEAFLYSRERALLPQGMIIAHVDVSGLSQDDAIALLDEHYLAPLAIYHRQERVEILPQDVGFMLDTATMMQQAETRRVQQDFWRGYLEHLIGRTFEPLEIELRATHDRGALMERLKTIASILDKPAKVPQLLGQSSEVELGEPGFVTNFEMSLPAAEVALYQPTAREAHLQVDDVASPPLNMEYLADNIEKQLSAFDGIGSVFILDLQTGEELGINSNIAMSGLSILKIAILLETYRSIDFGPTVDQAKLISETAVLSGDFSANLLLDVVAGQDNAYLGADILTESLNRLGLVNSFIITPYEEPARAGKSTLLTPANTRSDISTRPDAAMQTTAEDIGTLLAMIYRCAQGGGTLMAVYPDQITSEECQAILDVLVLNVEGNLIRYGVPEDVLVSHKHGWAGNTHGDAGVVFSPGSDYVIVEYLSQPLTDWLVSDVSFPILREISRTTYNYFNVENPNLEDPVDRAEREAAARLAEAEAATSETEQADP